MAVTPTHSQPSRVQSPSDDSAITYRQAHKWGPLIWGVVASCFVAGVGYGLSRGEMGSMQAKISALEVKSNDVQSQVSQLKDMRSSDQIALQKQFNDLNTKVDQVLKLLDLQYCTQNPKLCRDARMTSSLSIPR